MNFAVQTNGFDVEVNTGFCVVTVGCCRAEGCEQETVYGIALCGENPPVVFPDISTRREVVENLVERCNRNAITGTELYDILEDFLG